MTNDPLLKFSVCKSFYAIAPFPRSVQCHSPTQLKPYYQNQSTLWCCYPPFFQRQLGSPSFHKASFFDFSVVQVILSHKHYTSLIYCDKHHLVVLWSFFLDLIHFSLWIYFFPKQVWCCTFFSEIDTFIVASIYQYRIFYYLSISYMYTMYLIIFIPHFTLHVPPGTPITSPSHSISPLI